MDGVWRRWLGEGGGGWPGAALRGGLAPLGWAWARAQRWRRRAYARGRLASAAAPAPTVSVGNLAAGGTGKTPLALWLVRRLAGLGLRPALLARGYGARDPDRADEIRMARAALAGVPGARALAGRDRAALARRAVAGGADVLVLDDGFQHLRLRRGADLVLLDAVHPWGGGRCLPAGLLREPPDALAAADALVLTRCDQAGPEAAGALRDLLRERFPAIPVFLSRHRPARLARLDGVPVPGGPAALGGRRVVAAAGLGRPDAFFETLRGLGADLRAAYRFPDHHPYTAREAGVLRLAGATHGALVAVTEKDAAKLAGVWPADALAGAWVLGVDLDPDRPEALLDLVWTALALPGRAASPAPSAGPAGAGG